MPSLYTQILLAYSLVMSLLLASAVEKKQYGGAAFLASLLVTSVIILK